MTETITIILTCYFEGELLQQTIPRLRKVLDTSGLRHEFIIVVDGSDERTDTALQQLLVATPGLAVLRNPRNIGRGGSVARGVSAARGTIAGFIDPDLEINPAVIPAMVVEIHAGVELVIARRDVPLRPGNAFRWMLSKGYKRIANFMLQLPDIDTESGCKFFRVEALRPVLANVQNTRWFWDTELVARAIHQRVRVAQISVPYVRSADHATTVRVVRDTLEYLRELIRLRRQLRRARRDTNAGS